MKEKDKKPLDKLAEHAAYENLSKRDRDLLLVYEDKTYLLFGNPKKKK
jgi:hypothetical protein